MHVLILGLLFGVMVGATQVSGTECMDFEEFQSVDNEKAVGKDDAVLYYMGNMPRFLNIKAHMGTREGWVYVKHVVRDRNEEIIFTEVDVIRMVSKDTHVKNNYLYDKEGKCFSSKEQHKRIALLNRLGIERYITSY